LLENIQILDFIIVLVGYILLLCTSGIIVRVILIRIITEDELKNLVDKKQMDTGVIVGKCENILILTFMLLQAYTALGLVFAAKAIVRMDKMKGKKSFYFLTGTMVNVTYSIIVGFIVKILIEFV
jgi:hypothetical protein